MIITHFESKYFVSLLLVFVDCVQFTFTKHEHDENDGHSKGERHENQLQVNTKKPQAYTFPPKLIIFDLDSLMWPFWIGTELVPPLTLKPSRSIVDARGLVIRPYPQVEEMLNFLNGQGYNLAVVGRTGHNVLDILKWNDKFKYKEIYPGSKTVHIKKLSKLLDIHPHEILYYGYDLRQTNELFSQNVSAVAVSVDKQMQDDVFLLQQKTKLNFREMVYIGYDTDDTHAVERKLSTPACIADNGCDLNDFTKVLYRYSVRNKLGLPKMQSMFPIPDENHQVTMESTDMEAALPSAIKEALMNSNQSFSFYSNDASNKALTDGSSQSDYQSSPESLNEEEMDALESYVDELYNDKLAQGNFTPNA